MKVNRFIWTVLKYVLTSNEMAKIRTECSMAITNTLKIDRSFFDRLDINLIQGSLRNHIILQETVQLKLTEYENPIS